MPQESNTKAAEGTRSAAKAHLTAAEHHGTVITPRPVSIRRRRTGTQKPPTRLPPRHTARVASTPPRSELDAVSLEKG